MVTDFRHVIPRLGQRIEELGRAVVRDSQEITGWRMHRGDVDDGASPILDDSGWDALESWDDTDARAGSAHWSWRLSASRVPRCRSPSRSGATSIPSSTRRRCPTARRGRVSNPPPIG